MIHPSTAAVVALLTGAAAFAQAPEKRYEAEVSYSLSYRAGASRHIGLDSSYGGFGPTYLRAGGAYFLGGLPVGARAEGSVETFTVKGPGLTSDTDFTKRMTAYFLFGGLAGELVPLPWLRLEGNAGWGLAGMPAIVYSTDPYSGGFASRTLLHTGPVLAGRADVALSPALLAELRLRMIPVSFGAKVDGSPVGARDFTMGLSVGTAALRLGGLRVIALVDYELALTGGGAASGDFSSSQVANRFGLTLRATEWPERRGLLTPPTGPGRIRGRVLAQDSGKPIASAQVEISGKRAIATDSNGRFRVDKVGPGPVSVEISASGYRVAHEKITVPAEDEAVESLTLVRKTGPGIIRGTVRGLESAEGGAPLAGVEVKVQGGPAVRSDEGGRFVLENVGPGPVSLSLSAKGYRPGEELVQVLPESEAEVSLTLAKASTPPLATFRGQVRSMKGGGVAAALRIPEAGVSTRAGADGRFAVRLPGGRYTVVFSAEGFVAQTKTVEVADGDQALYYVDLSPSEH